SSLESDARACRRGDPRRRTSPAGGWPPWSRPPFGNSSRTSIETDDNDLQVPPVVSESGGGSSTTGHTLHGAHRRRVMRVRSFGHDHSFFMQRLPRCGFELGIFLSEDALMRRALTRRVCRLRDEKIYVDL